MEAPPDVSWLPPELQKWAVLAIAVILVVGSVAQYFRATRAAEPPVGQPALDNIHLLGAAFSDTKALRDLAEAAKGIEHAAKEIKSILDKANERDLRRFDALHTVLRDIAQNLRDRRT